MAKGPITLAGAVLIAYGITGLIFGGQSFTAHAVSGTVNGPTWLGIEGNGWTNLAWIAGGGLLMLGSPMHWGAKTMALLVGTASAAMCVIALVDGNDVLGIFAANGWTKLAWGVVAVGLWILALLPRVGGRDRTAEAERDAALADDRAARRGNGAGSRFRRHPAGREEREPATTVDDPERTARR